MANGPVTTDQEANQQAIEALNQLYAETMAKLADLRREQMKLYRQVSARLETLAAKRAAEKLSHLGNQKE